MSGHSKWANIKHKKESADKKRGIIFTKMVREIMVSARLGGSDPSSNSRLRIAISKARASNVPRDTIERAVKKGAGELEGQTFEDLVYEIYAPGGIGIIVEALTDKKARTTPEIKSTVTKYNGNLAEPNAVSRLFQRRGYIMIDKKGINEDELVEIVIEAGAEDVKSEEEYVEIFTLPEDYSEVSDALSDKEIETVESGIMLLPLDGTEITVSDVEQATKLLKFIELLEEHDDVQAVYHNMVIDDAIVDAVNG